MTPAYKAFYTAYVAILTALGVACILIHAFHFDLISTSRLNLIYGFPLFGAGLYYITILSRPYPKSTTETMQNLRKLFWIMGLAHLVFSVSLALGLFPFMGWDPGLLGSLCLGILFLVDAYLMYDIEVATEN